MSKRQVRKLGKTAAAVSTAAVLAASAAAFAASAGSAGASDTSATVAFGAAQTTMVNTDASHGVLKDPNGRVVGRFAGTPGSKMSARKTAVDPSDGVTYVSDAVQVPGASLTPEQYKAGGYSIEGHLQDLGVPQTAIDKYLAKNPNMTATVAPPVAPTSFSDASGTAHQAELAGSISSGTIYASSCAVLQSGAGATWASCYERFSVKDNDPNADYRPDDSSGFGYGHGGDELVMGYVEIEYSGYVRIVSSAPKATMPGTQACATASIAISDGIVTMGYAFPLCPDKISPMWDSSLTYWGAKWTGRSTNTSDTRATAVVTNGRIGCFCTDGFENVFGWSHT